MNARRPSVIAGLPDFLVEDVTLSDISITVAEMQEATMAPSAIPEMAPDYPDPTMFGNLPASGLYVRHAAGVTLRNVEIRPLAVDGRAAILADDVRSLRGYAVRTGRVWLNNVRHATWLDYERIGKTAAAVSVSGALTEGVAVRGIVPGGQQEVEISGEVPASAVRAI